MILLSFGSSETGIQQIKLMEDFYEQRTKGTGLLDVNYFVRFATMTGYAQKSLNESNTAQESEVAFTPHIPEPKEQQASQGY